MKKKTYCRPAYDEGDTEVKITLETFLDELKFNSFFSSFTTF
jgi:hypothetical protein